ncbi:MAG TPA: Cj0069 family protein [Steroidobacteraceae bacterium]|jgi:hypothetical protein
MAGEIGKVALLWRGDREAHDAARPRNPRLEPVFEALAAHSVRAEAAVYSDECEDEIRSQLLGFDGVLVWVDPISDGKNRIKLDAMLRDIASHGVWVSTHPDVILKMGVKEVLYRTRHLGWGTDTALYRSAESLKSEFPGRLHVNEPRVLKRNRGNGGQGVWKVERVPTADSRDTVCVLEARRGSVPMTISLDAFLLQCEDYVRQDGCLVDQPFQHRLADGMIRCYVSANRVVGYGQQLIKALTAPPEGKSDSPAAQPGPRIMHSKAAPQFESLRARMESEWIPQMSEVLQICAEELPVIWDADFLYGARSPNGEDSYVLCEINVSSVLPIPPEAPEEIARTVASRLRFRKGITTAP